MKGLYLVAFPDEQRGDVGRRTVSKSNPNDLGRITINEAPMMKVRVFRHEAFSGCISPYSGIRA